MIKHIGSRWFVLKKHGKHTKLSKHGFKTKQKALKQEVAIYLSKKRRGTL
jgi:hypothetical protein